MESSDFQRVKHIALYCEDIAETIKRFGDSQENFFNDKGYQKSIAISIMQIGELSIGLIPIPN